MWLARGLFYGVNGAGCDLRCSYAPAPKQASAQVLRLGAVHTQPLKYTVVWRDRPSFAELLSLCWLLALTSRALKHSVAGYWSRRINEENCLAYKVADDALLIAQPRYHY